jgi:hypothetical protein
MAEQTIDLQPNSFLSQLIGGFLIDLAKAQDISNHYSKILGETYKKDPLLRVFPVPNGCISSVTMTLKMDIEGIGLEKDPPEAVLAHAYKTFGQYVDELLEAVLPDVSNSLHDNSKHFASPEKADRMADALHHQAWRGSLAQEVLECINPQMDHMVSAHGELNEKSTAEILGDAVVRVVIEHPDYAFLPEKVCKEERAKLGDRIRKKVMEADRMKKLRDHLADRPPCTEPTLRFSTASANLSTLGPELVGKLELQAGVRDYIVQAQPVPADAASGASSGMEFRLIPARH